MIENEFIPYQLALELRQLGFDEPCFGFYQVIEIESENKSYLVKVLDVTQSVCRNQDCTAPTYSQAFRFFREEYGLKHCIIPLVCEQGFSDLYESRIHQETQNISIVGNHKSYEEAEIACLREMIKIVKEGKNEKEN